MNASKSVPDEGLAVPEFNANTSAFSQACAWDYLILDVSKRRGEGQNIDSETTRLNERA